MVTEAKQKTIVLKTIEAIKDNCNINDNQSIAVFLLNDKRYFYYSKQFYLFFGWQGGTIWQLIEGIQKHIKQEVTI